MYLIEIKVKFHRIECYTKFRLESHSCKNIFDAILQRKMQGWRLWWGCVSVINHFLSITSYYHVRCCVNLHNFFQEGHWPIGPLLMRHHCLQTDAQNNPPPHSPHFVLSQHKVSLLGLCFARTGSVVGGKQHNIPKTTTSKRGSIGFLFIESCVAPHCNDTARPFSLCCSPSFDMLLVLEQESRARLLISHDVLCLCIA